MILTLVLIVDVVVAILVGTIAILLFRSTHQAGVFCMGLDMFLQILRPFKRFSTKLTTMWF